MATGIKRKGTQPPADEQDPARKPGPRQKKTWRWLVLGAVGLAILVAWLIPAIVAHSPILNWTIGLATAKLNGQVTVRSASLGWLSAPSISGIEIRDEQDQPLLEIPRATGNRSLLGLLWNRTDLGRFQLEQPKLSLLLRQDGSNLEDVLAALLETADREPPKAVDLELEIVDGKVSVRDVQAQQSWQVDQLQLALHVPADRSRPLAVQTSGTITGGPSPGQFAVELKTHLAAENQASQGSSEVMVNAQDVPLAMFGPVMGRFAPGTRLAGRLSSAIQCHVSGQPAPETMSVEGTVTAKDLILATPLLAGDRVQLEQIEASCKVALEDNHLEIERLVAESDVGSASFAGILDLSETSPEKMAVWLSRQRYLLSGRIDLAQLAGMLPETLRIREGTQVTSGQLAVTLASRRAGAEMVWHGQIEASNLTALNQGRHLTWQQPILISLAARQGSRGPVVERLDCQSDFLKVHAAGTTDEMTAQLGFDLNQLAGQLGQFVDLGGVRLAGDGWAQLNWKQSESRNFQTDGRLQLRNFHLAIPDRPAWTEPSLVATLSARGRTDFAADTRLDDAVVEIAAGPEQADRLHVRLAQPVLDVRGGGTWPIEVHSQGELARWPPRISPWVAVKDWQVAGRYDLRADLIGSAAAVGISDARIAVEQLDVRGPGLEILEPTAEITASGSWDHPGRRLELESANLTTESLAVQASDVAVALPPQGPVQLTGTLDYRGRLERITKWTADGGAPPPWRVGGEFAGQAQLRQSGGRSAGARPIAGTFDTVISDLVAVHQSGQRIDEKQIRLAGRGSYNAKDRALDLTQASLTSNILAAEAAGRWTAAGDGSELEVDGQLHYDMEKLSGLLRSYAGPEVHVAGSGSSPVSFRGPLALAKARAGAAVGWDWADVYGFRIGPGQLEATLADGTLQVRPVDLGVSEGRVRVASHVRLAPGPMELYVEQGPLVEDVRINPTMCAHALQYIAPVLAGVATAEGRFSIELDGCRIPLADPAAGEVAGRMIIHSAQIGPGPLVRELAVLLGRPSPAEFARQSVIPFRMVQGRVYHRDLELVFPELTIRTHGWVGLDKTLGLMAEMPIPPKWLSAHQVLDSALRNQKIQVPITGTLQRPSLDRDVLAQVSQQFLEDAARNLLRDGLNEGLQRLFSPPE